MRRSIFAAAIVFAITFCGAQPAVASAIGFQATNLPDGGGGDLWQYDYFLSGGNLLANQGFRILFDYTLYADLMDLTPVQAEYGPPVLEQPDSALMSPGAFDYLAAVDNPVFVGPFSVSFTWLGVLGTIPGSQPFSLYQLDASGGLDTLQEGVTSPIGGADVPEPSTLLLLATGAAAARGLRKRRNQAPL